MHSPFSFDLPLVFGFLSAMLLISILLRAKVAVIQRFLIPSCLIGGVLGMFMVNLGAVPIPAETLETFAYHFFNISFISVGLTAGEKRENSSAEKKEILSGALWMALIQGVCFPLQAIVGGMMVLIFGLFGLDLFSTFGFFNPLGLNEGPGQALSMGKIWEGAGFESAATIGLTFAAVGFFFAFLVGVPLANRGLRKESGSDNAVSLPKEMLQGISKPGEKAEPAGKLTINSGNADTLAFQSALVGMVYLVAYFLVDFFGNLAGEEVAKVLWGFFFVFGLGVASLVKWLMDRAGGGYLVDPGIQRRITGWSVDFLIVSTVASIQFLVVWKYFLPTLLIPILGGFVTVLAVLYFGKRLESRRLERTLAIYGSTTGTVSAGLLLLRIVDPDFKSSVALELALMNLLCAPVVISGLLLVNAPILWGWSLIGTMLVFALILATSLLLLRLLNYWKPCTESMDS